MNNSLKLPIDFSTNSIVVSRLISRYLEKYHGKRNTNCSTLARYLFDGHFVECSFWNSYFVFNGEFEFYSNQEVKPGDVLCFLYNSKFSKSGDDELMECYRRIHFGNAVSVLANSNDSSVVSSSRIREVYDGALYHYNDFYFAFCTETKDGNYVFVYQSSLLYSDGSGEGKGDIEYSLINLKDLFSFPGVVLYKKGKRKMAV